MAEFSELVQALTWLLTNRVQQKIDYIHGLLGDGNGRVRVSTVPGSPEVDFVYVRPDRFSDRTFKVFNKRIEGQDGDPVIIGELPWEPGLVQVVDMDWAAYADVGWGDDVTTTNRHGNSHQWRDGAPGIDTFNVYRRQFGDLKTYPAVSGTLNVGVSPYSLDLYGKQYQWPGTQNFDLSGALPTTTGTARMAMVYWSPASGTTQGYLGVATGTLGGDAEAIILNRPATPEGAIPSAFVKLRGGQSSITEFDIWDAREPFRPGILFGTGTAGLSADMIPISDTSGLYTGSTVEAALDEIGFDGARVSRVYRNNFGAVALQADAVGGLAVQGTGTFSIPLNLSHVGDPDTYIQYTDDQVDIIAGAITMIRADEAAQDVLTIGDVAQSGDVDVNLFTDHLIVQPTTDTTTALQVLDADGGTPILNVDSTNEGVGIQTDTVTFTGEGLSTIAVLYVERPDLSAHHGAVYSSISDTATRTAQNAFLKARAGLTALSVSDKIGDFQWYGHDGTDYNRSARFGAIVEGSVSANTVPMSLTFEVSATNTAGLAEQMKITPTEIIVRDDFVLTVGSQNYLFSDRSTNLTLQGRSAGQATNFEFFSRDGDGTDNVGFTLYGVGTPDAVTNRERAKFRYSSSQLFEIFTEAAGTGAVRALSLYTSGNTNQLLLNTNGSISFTDFLEGVEITAPAAGAANSWRIFGEDNGAGKTRVMIQFATGAAQQIAIQP